MFRICRLVRHDRNNDSPADINAPSVIILAPPSILIRILNGPQACYRVPAACEARVDGDMPFEKPRGRRGCRALAATHGPRATKKHAAEPQVQPNIRHSLRDGLTAYT
jgi:hypothetical protein